MSIKLKISRLNVNTSRKSSHKSIHVFYRHMKVVRKYAIGKPIYVGPITASDSIEVVK